MKADKLVDLLLETMTLKRLPRTGWGMRGVPHVESVADHSYGVVLVALALADAINASDALAEPLNLERVLTMAALHDLAEVRLTDLPATARHLISKEVKRAAEMKVITELLAPLPGAGRLSTLWQEFEDELDAEGRLVRDADKIEMMTQCLRYEQGGCRDLGEFWTSMDQHRWHYSLSADLYARLKALRPL
jgi:putative hydrolases of HD superfamily